MVLIATEKEVGSFHVVGGGCFGSQYARWLLRARERGMLAFERIVAIDRDPQCRLLREGPYDPSLEVVQADWVEYLCGLLLSDAEVPVAPQDHWVPSPLSPHLMMLGFQRAAQSRLAGLRFELEEFREEIPTPVKIPLASGDLAASFAEWQCPVNCIEPPNCPAIHAERTWDMKPSLEAFLLNCARFGSAQVLQCRHFVHGVGTIPMGEIRGAFEKFLLDIREASSTRVAVATVSRCHGLIGAARAIRS